MTYTYPTSIRLRANVAAEVEARGETRNYIINRDLERLYTLYKRALREVTLTVPEACLIVDVLNGTLMDANTVVVLWANVADGIQINGLDRKWEVDGRTLIEKLRGLSHLQALALVDAAERFWAASDRWESTEAGVRECFGIK